MAVFFSARAGLGNIGKESRTGLGVHDPVSVQRCEHAAPADNHQFTVTPASNCCNIELFDVQLCGCDNLLSKRKECVTGGGDNTELNLECLAQLSAFAMASGAGLDTASGCLSKGQGMDTNRAKMWIQVIKNGS